MVLGLGLGGGEKAISGLGGLYVRVQFLQMWEQVSGKVAVIADAKLRMHRDHVPRFLTISPRIYVVEWRAVAVYVRRQLKGIRVHR